MKVAIIDTGIDYNNDDLGNGTWNTSSSKVAGGYNYYYSNTNPMDDDNVSSHGTAVAGIIGAYRNNNNRIAGLAGGDAAMGNPGATLYALKVFSKPSDSETGKPKGSVTAFAAALIDAAKPIVDGGFGCNIANYSGGGYEPSNVQGDALRYAARKNLLLVASKGNDNTTNLHYPSDFRGNWVLSVGASDELDQRSSFSNYGNGVDVVAAGESSLVYTTKRVADGSEGSFNGTSAAAPIVAGIAALLKSQNPNLHRDDMEELIKLSAEKVPGYTYTNGYNDQMGYGRVNAGNAMAYLKAPYKLIQKTEIGGAIEDVSSLQTFIFNNGVALPAASYIGRRYRIKRTIQKPFCSGENYLWSRIEGASLGWSGANPNDQENYIYRSNETSTSIDLTTWVYYIQSNTAGQTINTWYPCAPENVQFAYTALGLENYEIPTGTISGPSQFCTTATYSISSLPTGITVSWSTNAPSGITLTPSGNSVTITETGTVTERTDILTATLSGTSCTPVTLQANITHGVPNVSAGIGKLWGGGPQAWFFTIGGTIPQSPIKFDVQSTDGSLLAPFPPMGPASTSLTNVAGIFPHGQNGSNWVSNPIALNVRARNACGTSEWQTVYIDRNSSSMFSVSPNPASNELTVSSSQLGFEETTNSNAFASTASGKTNPQFSVKLFDEKGKLLISGTNKNSGKSIKADVSQVPDGTYFLHIFIGKSVVKKQIIIKH